MVSTGGGPALKAPARKPVKLLTFASEQEKKKYLERQHNKLRQDLQAFVAKKSQSDAAASENAKWLLNLDEQNENVRHVAYSCSRINKMLEKLDTDTVAEDPMAVLEAPTAKVEAKVDEPDEVLALRAFASDDTTLETTSVADYAADPPAAPLFSDRCIAECVDVVSDSSEKCEQSISILTKLVRDHPQWWNSAIVVRRIKTHAIRTNYHARKIRLNGDQCRSHLFVSSSVVNRTAMDATADLRELKAKQIVIDERRRQLENVSDELDADNERLKKELERLEKELEVVNVDVEAAAGASLGMEQPELPPSPKAGSSTGHSPGASTSDPTVLTPSGIGRTASGIALGHSRHGSSDPSTSQKASPQPQQHKKDAASLHTADCELALLLTKLTVLDDYAESAAAILHALGACW